MRTFITALMASTMAVAAFSAAKAADAIDQIPQAPIASEPYAAPAAGNWAGAYGGATVQYDMGRFGNQNDYNAKAFGGSLYGGYNLQSGQVVYGAEADIGYNGENGNDARGFKGKQGVNGSIRARVGYDFNPFLLYGTAGLAAANHKLDDGVTSDDKTALGYTVGAGVETFVTDNITARVEYRYSDYQKKDFNLSAGQRTADYDDHSIKLGVGMKF